MFKDPIKPQFRKAEKEFAAPTKEQATTGRAFWAGDRYGVGFKTPVGKMKASGIMSGPIPMKTKCVDPDEV